MKSRHQPEAHPKQPVKGMGMENLVAGGFDVHDTPEARQESLDHLVELFDGLLEKGREDVLDDGSQTVVLNVNCLLLGNKADEKGYRSYEGSIGISARHDPQTDTRSYYVVAHGGKGEDTNLQMVVRNGVVESAEIKDGSTDGWEEEPDAFQTGMLQRKFFNNELADLYPVDGATETTVRNPNTRDVRIVRNTRLRKMGHRVREIFWVT